MNTTAHLQNSFGRRGPVIVSIVWLAAGALAAAPVRAEAPRLEVYFAADFSDAAYQKKIYQKVASSWKRPSSTPKSGGKAVVIAVIRKDGSAPEPTLHYKSGSDAWDSAALEAVRKAAPFDPLPKSYPRPTVEVHFHFEWSS